MAECPMSTFFYKNHRHFPSSLIQWLINWIYNKIYNTSLAVAVELEALKEYLIKFRKGFLQYGIHLLNKEIG